MNDLADFERRFAPSSLEFHGMLTLVAMLAHGRRRFGPILKRLESLDDTVFAQVPWLRRWAWLSVLEGTATAHRPSERPR